MPRRNIDEHFEEERPEWTRRKHQLLERYVNAAAMKMRLKAKAVVLVDGYAGANRYGQEEVGSTSIMAKAARAVRNQGARVTVHACEPDKRRFDSLISNLRPDLESGLLRAHNLTHSEALPAILREIGVVPAVVFLDPHAVTQMTLAEDILPWAKRADTDVLGVFMAGQACRTCGQYLKGASQKVEPAMYLGPSWQKGRTEEGAYACFFEAIGNHKRFKGLYRLRKIEPHRDAYGIFGLSDHPDGFWLLSNAVAKDYGALRDFDVAKLSASSLFAESDHEDEERTAFERLVEIATPTIRQSPKLRGAKLASALFSRGIGVEELFGRFEERDFTTAALSVLELPDRRKHGKANRD